MDRETLAAYDTNAAGFARDWRDQPPPSDLHALVQQFFIPGGLTADIGCGCGREVAWLAEHGYRAHGYDASQGLIAEARDRHPELAFDLAVLPALDGLAAGSFDNVLCETVIMHLPDAERAVSVQRLFDIVRPGGVLDLSWRISRDGSLRDMFGRLYAAFEAAEIRYELSAGAVLHDQEIESASSGKLIHRLIVAKRPAAAA